ncbi:hypothetical protein [Sorangium cellulosum]|uniref:hypothetical protein n=1 Tax=Sorangium cellulosum TaxID=56 RepID=UPI001331A180|nr:hypothetical protein [Sorangium cellulosum]
MRPWQLDLAVGVRGGSGVLVSEGRLFLGWCGSRDAGTEKVAWLPYFSAGLSASAGAAWVDDPRGVGGEVRVARYTLGPELRAGLAGESGTMDHYVYLAVAPVYVFAGTLSDRLPEAGGALGARAAFGIGLPAKWRTIFGSPDERSCDGSSECLVSDVVFFVMPNHAELAYENAAGSSHRVGGAIGYSF